MKKKGLEQNPSNGQMTTHECSEIPQGEYYVTKQQLGQDGKLESRQEKCKADQNICRIQTWHPNGQKKSRHYCYDTLMHGIYKVWDPDGIILQKFNYCHGLLHGDSFNYVSNGVYPILQIFQQWNHGVRHGKLIQYDLNGAFKSERTYNHDVLQGLCRIANGDILECCWYESGQAIRWWQCENN